MACVFAVFALNRCVWCGPVHTQYIYIYIHIYISCWVCVKLSRWMRYVKCSVCVMSSDLKKRCSLKMFSECRSAWWCPSHHSPWILALPSKGPTTSLRVIWLRITRATGDMTDLRVKWVKSHILYSNYKYLRPNILYWCTMSIYISFMCELVCAHADARVCMRLFF